MDRKYPNNITTNGTTIKQGFTNDDADIKNLYQLIEAKADKSDLDKIKDSTSSSSPSKPSSSTTVTTVTTPAITEYNTVLDCHYDVNGNPDFLTCRDGCEYVGINGEDTTGDGTGGKPVVINFAAGYDDNGHVKSYTETIKTNNLDVWHVSTEAITYLYVERTNDGKLNFVTSAYSCPTAYAFPSNPDRGMHIYNPNTAYCYYYTDAKTWVIRFRVCVGYAKPDAHGKIKVYALRTASTQLENKVMHVADDGVTVNMLNPKDIMKPADVTMRSLTANYVKASVYGNVTGDVTGNASTADKLKKPITVTIGGDLSDVDETKLTLDGSADITVKPVIHHAVDAENAGYAAKANEAYSAKQADVAFSVPQYYTVPDPHKTDIKGNIFIVWPKG